MDKRFLAIVGIILAVFVGILWFNNSKKADAPDANAQPTNHVKGAGTTGVTLTEYGDFQCPYCGAFYPTIEQVVQKYGDQIKFQYRHYPLSSAHKNAFAASRAAEAAGLQGKFWEMYGLLFQNQQVWSESNEAQRLFEGYASQLQLNVDQFKTDFASAKVAAAINADIATFNKLNLPQSTPTFLLNGKKIQPEANTVEAFSKLIDTEIEKAKQQ